MMQTSIFKQIGKREPKYSTRFKDFMDILKQDVGGTIGSKSASEFSRSSKFFKNIYELYIYATVLGIQQNKRTPLSDEYDKKSFLPISQWNHPYLQKFIIGFILKDSGKELFYLESLSEEDLRKEISSMINNLEEYANTGLQIMYSKYLNDSSYYIFDKVLIDLLDENYK